MHQITNYTNNNLFTEKFLNQDLKELHNFNESLEDKFKLLKSIFNKDKLEKLNEAQLETEFIEPVLKNILNFSLIPQIVKKVQGKIDKPDFGLFATEELKEKHYSLNDKSSNQDILLFCEAKGYLVNLDNGKIDFKQNPHFQLMHYLTYLKVNYGFLTNGKFWRFYNIEDNSSNKVFFEINLQEIILNNDLEAFKYFYHIFKKENFIESKIEDIIEINEKTKFQIEDNLKSIIYGKDSIIELISKEIYKNNKDKELKEIFNNSIYFTFRLLFISYFENKFETTTKEHKYYNDISLEQVYSYLESLEEHKLKDYVAYKKLKELFNVLDKGDIELEIPLFNGGLFDTQKTPILNQKKLLNNTTLKTILSKLLIRDFKALSVIHIGNIYEGLLEYKLRIAKETLYYVKINKEENYYDTYDFENLKLKEKSLKLLDTIEKGNIYLVNKSNSRKTTASYYTPKSLSSFMVKSAIDLELSKETNPLEIKILDNACGSGHFLVEALDYITKKTYENINQNISNLIEEEKLKIEENLQGFKTKIELDELLILKRILLKKVIYGVDLNPFAIELTRLSLWIDTFIFGTPLSFIEHHIKVGNSLIGSTIEELDSYIDKDKSNLFKIQFKQDLEELKIIYKELENLKDTTPKEIKESKHKYNNEIMPKLNKLNQFLNSLTYLKFKKTLSLDILNLKDEEITDIEKYKNKYSFFNYNIEFPETNNKFNIILGNPPWDKTKFDDKDFFSQFRSNYRTMKNKEKKEVQDIILSNSKTEKEYIDTKEHIKSSNDYFKEFYPLNAGAGDGNLFRFFIEKNISLLKPNGILTYIFPATFISEDSSINIRKHILENLKMNYFYGFENKNAIFKDVDSRFKFAIMQLENKKDEKQIVKTRFMQTNPTILETKESILNYDLKTIKTLSPNHYSFLELQNPQDLEIIKKAYLNFNQINSNYIDFRRELDMTNDKDLFQEEYKKELIPLFEGKMIHQFNPNFKEANYYLDIKKFDKRLESKEVSRLKKDIQNKELKKLEDFIRYDREFFRLGFRATARNTDERTLIFSILPKNIGCGNSIYVNIPKKYIIKNNSIEIEQISNSKLLFLNSIFNSLIVDYISRFIINSSVNKTYLMRLPIPQPNETKLKEEPYKTLIKNALLLTLTNNQKEFKEFKDEFKIEDKEIPKTQKAIDLLKIQNDIIVSNLYKITKEELNHITKTFKVQNNKNPIYSKTLLEKFEED